MLKLMPTVKEGTHVGIEGAMPYDILLNEKKIGAFTLYLEPKENHEALCGWADQYVDDYYWGDKDSLLRLVLSTQAVKNKAQSFILVSDLVWMISDDELFARGDDKLCLADYFVLQLEELRISHQANLCYISSIHENPQKPQWEFVLEGLGFKPVSQTDLETFFVSSRHLCAECLTAWAPIEEPICLGCHQEKYHANICN